MNKRRRAIRRKFCRVVGKMRHFGKMNVPDNKKYLLYIRTAKAGSTSFIEYLSSIKPIISYERDIYPDKENAVKEGSVIITAAISILKNQHPNIFNDSYKIMLARNPYTRLLSGYYFHPLCRGKSINDLLRLRNKAYMEYGNYDGYKILNKDRPMWGYFSLYFHFYAQQTRGLIENNKLIVDDIIRFEDFNENIKNFVESTLKINHIRFALPHIHGNKHTQNIADLTPEDIALINTMFRDDFKFLNYPTIAVPPLT